MFAGKSTLLLQRLRDARQPFVLFKPALDTRYASHHVVTHAGERLAATPVSSAEQIRDLAADHPLIGIDEAHFFGTALIAPILALLRDNRHVIIAGLERDHRGEPFEPFPRLLCEADQVFKLSGPCACCGRPAVHSQRMVQRSERIVVGGAEAYEPRCRDCFTPGA